jgi:hypothetical protein
VRLGKSATETLELLREAFGAKRQKMLKKFENSSTIHELADTVGMDQLWSLPGVLNRIFEHAPHCREVCSPPLDK